MYVSYTRPSVRKGYKWEMIQWKSYCGKLVLQQEGNGPIDLRRQGQWEIGMLWCMISINPTLNYLGGHLTSYLKSATLITLVFMCILPQMASEAMATSKQPRRSFDLRFEISNLDYPGIHVHIASNGLRGHGDLLMTSEVIWPQIWNQQPWLPWYPCAYWL